MAADRFASSDARARSPRRRRLLVAAAPLVLAACTSGVAAPAPEPGTTTIPPTTARAPISAAGSASVPVGTTLAPLPAPDAFAEFDRIVQQELAERGTIAASVAVSRSGRLAHTFAFGPRQVGGTEPVTPATRFRLASISKPILAATVLDLVEDGVLGLDQPVLGLLAQRLGVTFGDPAMAGITVRHLLGHTSGFPEYERTFFGGLVDSCTAAAARGLSRGLLGPPGTLYRYANMNYCLLGLVVEQATGRPYPDVVQERLLTPLGITDMATVGTHEFGPNDALHPTSAGRVFMEALGGAGSWVATAADVVRIVDALDATALGPHPVGAALLDEMRRPAAVTYPNPGRWYGLGTTVWDQGQSWGHTGTVESARTMVVHRADGTTWALLVNGAWPTQAEKLRPIVDEALATVVWPS